MAFSVPAMTNATTEVDRAKDFSGPTGIRLFTVGQLTILGGIPEDHLLSIEQNWTVASGTSIVPPGPKNICDNCPAEFQYFSAVCWVFGRTVRAGLGGKVPVGLISNNWPGTTVETWSPPEAFRACNRTAPSRSLYNVMLHPYTVGPMAVAGFTW